MNEPGRRRWPPVDLRGAQINLDHLDRGQQVAAILASRSTTSIVPRYPQVHWEGISTQSQEEIAAYCMRSPRRFCSATLPGGVMKSFSSASIRSRRPMSLFPVTVSCRLVRQTRITGRGRRRTS